MAQVAAEHKNVLLDYVGAARRLEELGASWQRFEATRQAARDLRAVAENAKVDVVREVFTDSLNKIWRDLFVRLVPAEPFVPAFRVPSSAEQRLEVELETVHRDGGVGGSPGTMLSAGNLNTGAVTLFLALHLSVQPDLPWLVLDDPVQSMDEVHIAQFAALLRVLAKQHGRRVVIAVHERSLFDYLRLELSPAFPGDRLITVDLARSRDGTTVAESHFLEWKPEEAVSAG